MLSDPQTLKKVEEEETLHTSSSKVETLKVLLTSKNTIKLGGKKQFLRLELAIPFDRTAGWGKRVK